MVNELSIPFFVYIKGTCGLEISSYTICKADVLVIKLHLMVFLNYDYHRNSAIHQCSAVGAALAAKRAGKEMELLACQPRKFADKSVPTLILRQLFAQESEN